MWEMWRDDIPSLDRESWDDSLEGGPKPVISFRDKLILVKFLHRVYYTSVRLHKMYPARYLKCPLCRIHLGSYLHMFWDCPSIAEFWSDVFELINFRLQLSLPASLELALLGIHEYK